MSTYTKINFLGHNFKNPLIAASGTYGYGREYQRFYSPDILGGIALKGLTLYPRVGNSGMRLWETPAGLLNSIGLENPGLQTFMEQILPDVMLLSNETQVLVNIAGESIDDYKKVIAPFNQYTNLLYEINVSCPNVTNGIAFGADPEMAYKLVQELKRTVDLPLIIKLTPNCASIVEVAKACQEAGADALSLINTIQAMAIDVDKRRPVFDNIYAGLSGPAIKPIALKMVYDVSNAVDIPVIGIGGISSHEDVLEFMLAGASLVEVGTYNFNDPFAMVNIIDELEYYCYTRQLYLERIIGRVES